MYEKWQEPELGSDLKAYYFPSRQTFATLPWLSNIIYILRDNHKSGLYIKKIIYVVFAG